MGDFFVNLGKFILGGILKVLVIVAVVLLVWLVICVIVQNGFIAGWEKFKASTLIELVIVWLQASWFLLIRGDIQGVVFGVLLFFVPVIFLIFITPNPDIELYDGQGNLWTLTKR